MRAPSNEGSLPWSASEPGALIQLEGGVALDHLGLFFLLVGWLVGWSSWGPGGTGKLWNLWVFFYMFSIYGWDNCGLKRCGLN